MAISKRLITLLLASTLAPLPAFADQLQTEESNPSQTVETSPRQIDQNELLEAAQNKPQPAPEDDESAVGGLLKDIKDEIAPKKLWERAKKELRNAKLKQKIDIPIPKLADGFSIGANYTVNDSPSVIAGKYSGIDIWEVNLSAYPQLFNLTDLPFNFGFSYTRQLTYIQQFEGQFKAVARVPYDPITKIPFKSDVFFKTHKNPFTGKVKKVLKPGDFIGYRIPMSLYFGKGLSEVALSYFGLNASLSYVLSGEFDVQVFVMDDYTVRAKIMVARDRSFGASVGVNIVGFNGIGKMIVNTFINTNLLNIAFNRTNSNLFVADYIFNLKNQESRDLYDSVMGSQFRLANTKIFMQMLTSANLFTSEKKSRDRVMGSLEEINEVAAQDADLPYADRRILKVITAQNVTTTDTFTPRINLFNILQVESSESKSGSKITLYAKRNDIKARFKLDSYNQSGGYKVLYWGEKASESSSFITRIDDSDKAINIIGLQNSTISEDKHLRPREYTKYMNRLKNFLPAKILENIELPSWNYTDDKSVENANIQHYLTFNETYFNTQRNLSEDFLRKVMLLVLRNHSANEDLKSLPRGANLFTEKNKPRDPMIIAYQRGDYVNTYINELLEIPRRLAIILNSDLLAHERYDELVKLYNEIPLFYEIKTEMLLHLVPEDQLEKMVSFKLVMSGKGKTTLITQFPKVETSKTNNLFKEIMAQKGFIDDRSFNLKNYIREDGAIYTLDEVMNSRAEKEIDDQVGGGR